MGKYDWTEEEIKIALHLYLNRNIDWIKKIRDDTEEIVGLSKLLNALDFYQTKSLDFRTPSSIRLRLANFLAEDDRYTKKSLKNGGNLVKEIWERYNNNLDILHKECEAIISKHIVYFDISILNYLLQMKLNIFNFEDKDSSDLIIDLKKVLSNEEGNNTKSKCTCIGNSKDITDDILASKINNNKNTGYHNYFDNYEYKEHAGINLSPILFPTGKQINDKIEMKIGSFVRQTFSDMVNKQLITYDLVLKLLDHEYSRKNFGLKLPFLRMVDDSKKIRYQLYDDNGYIRYWVTPLYIKGQKYCVNKEWYEEQRTRFINWLESLKYELIFQTNPILLASIIEEIKYLDDNYVYFTKELLQKKFNNKPLIDNIIDKFKMCGVISALKEDQNKFVIDDYDLFYKIYKNPESFTTE